MRVRSVICGCTTLLLAVAGIGCSSNGAPPPDEPLPVGEPRWIFSVGPTGAGACDAPREEAALRFVLATDKKRSIGRGDVLTRGGEPFELQAGDVSFETGTVYELPDEPCEAPCTVAGMNCTAASAEDADAEPRCRRSVELAVDGHLEWNPNEGSLRLFGVMLEGSASITGELPDDVGRLHPDWDGDGIGEGVADLGSFDGRASDPRSVLQRALSATFSTWVEVAVDTGRVRWGHWTFAGTSVVAVTASPERVWSAPGFARSPLLGSKGFGRANVFMAVTQVLESDYSHGIHQNADKTLVVIVDGPDDLRSPHYTADDVIDAAHAVGARVSIVHFDPAVTTTMLSGTPAFRDDPNYWGTIDGEPVQPPCSDDTDCRDYERCRVPTAYALAQGGRAVIDPKGERYCMPTRNASTGRFGPIGDYARIACETGGGYRYLRGAAAVRPAVQWLPHLAAKGSWSVPVSVQATEPPELPTSETYLLETTLRVDTGETEVSREYSPNGYDPRGAQDTRTVLFR